MIRLLITVLAVLQTAAAEIKLPSFELVDQFGVAHRIAFPSERPVLITVADQKGAPAMEQWIGALKNRYGTNVTYVAIADTHGTPALMRPFIKAQFKKKYPHPVLLDWDGKISLQLSAKPNVPNIYLFSTMGDLQIAKNETFSERSLSDFPILKKPSRQGRQQ
jgi:hypothetical protein